MSAESVPGQPRGVEAPQSGRFRFLANMVPLSVGAAAGQGIAVLLSPLLTRLYGPDAFGVFANFAAVSGTIGAVVTLRCDMAILLEKRDAQAAVLVVATVVLAVLLAVAGSALLFVFAPVLGAGGDAGVQTAFVVWCVLSVLILGLSSSASAWALRRGDFRLVGMFQFTRSFFNVATQIAISVVTAGWIGLVVGQVVGQGAALATLLWMVCPDVHARLPALSVWRMWSRIVRHRNFVLYTTPQTLMNALTGSMPVVLLGYLFSPQEAGLYFLVHRTLLVPNTVLVESIRRVYFRGAVLTHRSGGDLFAGYLKVSAGLAALCAPVVAVLAAFGPDLFAFAFGGAWRSAGEYARWIAFSWAFSVVCVPSAVLANVLGYQRSLLAFEALGISVATAAVWAGAQAGTAAASVAFMSLAGCLLSTAFAVSTGMRVHRRHRGGPPAGPPRQKGWTPWMVCRRWITAAR